VPRLAAGNADNGAVRAAWRRLRASETNPVMAVTALPVLAPIDPVRAAAALLIPLHFSAVRGLCRTLVEPPDQPAA